MSQHLTTLLWGVVKWPQHRLSTNVVRMLWQKLWPFDRGLKDIKTSVDCSPSSFLCAWRFSFCNNKQSIRGNILVSKNFIIKKITLIKLTCLHFGEARYASSDVENLGEAIRGVFRVIMTAFDYKMREREQWNGTKIFNCWYFPTKLGIFNYHYKVEGIYMFLTSLLKLENLLFTVTFGHLWTCSLTGIQ